MSHKPIQISTEVVKHFYMFFCVASLVLVPVCYFFFRYPEKPIHLVLAIAFTASFLFTAYLLYSMADAKIIEGKLIVKKIKKKGLQVTPDQIKKISAFKVNKIRFAVVFILKPNGKKEKFFIPSMKSKFGAASIDPIKIIQRFKDGDFN